MFILPGGKVESFDETQGEIIRQLSDGGKERNYDDVLLNTIRREVYEELKIDLPHVIDYFCSNFFINTREEQVIDVVFYTKLQKHPEIVVDGDEVKSFIWMNQREILDSDQVNDWLKKALRVFDRID
jgi:8-oxo-dGTP pyrophosphatase MutT (NUDIX family)